MTLKEGSNETVLDLRGVTVELGGRTILDDISIDIKRGEFVAVLGPNGAGKTTLFKLLLGLLKANKGSVSILGKPPRRGNADIGYAPQHRAPEPNPPPAAGNVSGSANDEINGVSACRTV